MRDHAVAESVPGSAAAEEARLWARLRELRESDFMPAAAESDARLREMRAVASEVDEVRGRLTELWRDLSAEHPHLRTVRMAEPVTAAELPELLRARHAEAVLVEFLVGRTGVHALICTADELRSMTVAECSAEQLAEFGGALAAGEATGHPLLEWLAEVVDQATGGGPVFVVPHHVLHLAPLHLDASGEVRPLTRLLPSASVLRATAVRRPAAAAAVLVAGDPTGDLPFARAECAHAATRFGVDARYGAEATTAWLTEALAGGATKLVHLACHGEFDARRPARSGLLVAGPDGAAEKLALDRLATMDWSGALVVLSACHVGRHQVRRGDDLAGLGRTLIAAGATALIIAPGRCPTCRPRC